MSWLSKTFKKLLKPSTALRGLVDPAGALIGAASGTPNTFRGMIDPAGLSGRAGSGDRFSRFSPPGVMSAPALPPQLQRRPAVMPEPTQQGDFTKLAFQMAGPTGPGSIQPNPGGGYPIGPPGGMPGGPPMRIPRMPGNGILGMTQPTDILRYLGRTGGGANRVRQRSY